MKIVCTLSMFRTLIVLNIVLFLISVVLPLIDGAWLSEKELDVLSYMGYEAYLSLPTFLLWGIMLGWLIVMLGMFKFYSIARTAFLWWLCITALLVVGGGLDTRTALQSFLADTGNILDGVIIALAYFSDVQKQFSTEKS